MILPKKCDHDSHTETSNTHYCATCFKVLKPYESEAHIQRDMKTAFDALFADDAELVHNNNNQTNKVAGAKAAAMGVRKGIADLTLYLPKAKTIFVEVKTHNGSTSKAQIEKAAKMKELGYDTYIVKPDSDTDAEFIRNWVSFVAAMIAKADEKSMLYYYHMALRNSNSAVGTSILHFADAVLSDIAKKTELFRKAL